MEQSVIPVIVLSGFLGSGKTTLLLRLLKHANENGLRVSVLMNEVGKVDVDGVLVSSSTANQIIESITEGCLCCTKKSELASCLERLALQRPDVIVIELTGVANPEEIAEAMTEPAVIGKVALHRIITVLDAEHALDYNSIFSSDRELIRTLRRQIEVADAVIANKADLISDRTKVKVEQMVRERNPGCALVPAIRCDVPPDLAFAGIVRLSVKQLAFSRMGTPTSERSSPPLKLSLKSAGRPQQEAILVNSQPAQAQTNQSVSSSSQPDSSGSYSRVRTVAIYPEASPPLSRRHFEDFITGRGNRCLRAKGYMPFGTGGKLMLFQLAGRRVEWSPANYEGRPYFVMIGIDLNAAQIEQEWRKLTKS
ncbi:CobW family GTP-binding protein [Paenibacillus solisilvae]|uniref:CobW family GTP-binding protein n=1 Tax=Paenibacillus solisilvae TaxID=2486751 RepID=A0ABW0VZR7_9BACL